MSAAATPADPRTLRHVPYAELERIRTLDADPAAVSATFADACRLNVLTMVEHAGSGHLGTSLSCMDMLSWLYLEHLGTHDRFFSSKGHDAPALYSVLLGLGRLPFEKLFGLRRLGGLPGHPDVLTVPELVTNTGSLGMGIAKARGFILADRQLGRAPGEVVVLTGDGELQEGQFWESLQPTANLALGEITVIVDHNKIQSDTWVEHVSDLGDLVAKVRSFGWAVARCDGNDTVAFSTTLARLQADAPNQPKLLVADTRKGAGVSFMEPHDLPQTGAALYGYHSGAPGYEKWERAFDEVLERLQGRLAGLAAAPVTVAATPYPARRTPAPTAQRLVGAWSRAIVAQAERDPNVVALVADLRLDTGLVPFQERFPERFHECGIAEMDMVSMAGTMALAGLAPVVHSFACFLTPRANEQIFNNGTEGTRIVYHGSLAGLLPAGPGHSHQSVRDAALMGSVPGMAVIQPSWETEVEAALDWALREAPGSTYVRLVTPPVELPFAPPPATPLVPGRGTVLRGPVGPAAAPDLLLIAAGPWLVAEAWKACDLLAGDGIEAALVALPWLKDVDGGWLCELAAGAQLLVLDDHVETGGLASAVRNAGLLAARHGVDGVPECGQNDEVLRAHGLDAAGIAAAARANLGGSGA